MSKNDNRSTEELRRQAEKRLKNSKKKGTSPATPEELQRLVHELEVYQIELEMQNEALQQARSELEAYLGQYTDLYDFAPAGYFTLDHSGVILRVNLTGVRMLGLERARLLNRRFDRFVPAGFRPDFASFLEKVFLSQSQESFELALQKEGSGALFAHVEARVSEDGQECRVALVDISAQKEAEEALRESERKYRTLFETMSQAVVHQGLDGKIISANPAVERILGLSTDQLLGKTSIDPHRKAIHENGTDFPEETHPSMVALRTGKAVSNVVMGVYLPQAGGYSWLNITAVPQFLPGEERPFQVFTTFEDITERKRMEAGLKKAKEEAEAANTAKSRFLANISHEIRTPMNVIIGMADLAFESAHSREQKEYIDMIRESAASLLALINDILDISKIEAHRLELAKVECDLYREVERMVSSFAPQAQKKGLELSYSIASNIPQKVLGDPARLRQVLVNLIRNAIKFTEKGNILVSLRRDEKDKAEGEGEEQDGNGAVTVRFSISDTGIGIPADKVGWLFENFTQLDSSGTHKFEGTGLGLAIARSLVDLMGGSIGVTSVENRGSTFYFTIPFALPRPGAETTGTLLADESGESLSDEPLPDQEKTLEILLVEDKPMNRKLATVLLEKKGHLVIEANDGEEALKKLKSERFDLILMDIQMPKMDGLEAAARIRAWDEEAVKHIPIIAMTAYAMREDRERCLQAGMDYYLSKPINRAELYYVLDKVIEGRVDELKQQAYILEDAQEMLNRVDGNKELLEELVKMFFEDYPSDIENLKESMEKKDASTLAFVVHGLKGELGNMGMKSAYKIACELEKMVKENTLDEADAIIQKLEDEVARLERFYIRPGWQGRIGF